MNTPANPIAHYFDRIYCINLLRRRDRRAHAEEVFRKLGILASVQWFDGIDKPRDHEGRQNGNLGCTMSHRAVLEIIAEGQWERSLVFEDDVDFAFLNPQECQNDHHKPGTGRRVDAQALFQQTVPELPATWDMLYLGGHYAETPQKRISPHVVKIGRMFTTSSYGITRAFAAKIKDSITGIGPIDTLYSGFTPHHDCYCLDPRIFNQMNGYSDLMEKSYNPSHAMQDMNHVKALDAGTTYG